MLPSDRAKRTTRRRAAAFGLDFSIGVLLFLCAGIWGTVHWKRAVTDGLPFFYQNYFEPAVMIACGKGFVVAQPQIPEMAAFLAQHVDRFSCDAIPRDAALGAQGLYQGAWRYLMLAVGGAWRLLGISWSGMGPFFGMLFALTTVAGYAIFRLGMGPLLAVLCAVALTVSKLQLAYLPILRDYAKAPFTLILVFLLGLLVIRRPTWRNVLAVGAAYGAAVGLGYGFRTDFLANIPPFFVTLIGFSEGGVFKNLRMKAAAGALCAATFVVVAWPIISAVQRAGGCQWHVVLLGFPTGFSRPLGIEEPAYKLSRVYSDNFVYATVTSYAARVQPEVGHIEYCHPEYDLVTGRYLRELAWRFPADMLFRAYAAALRIVELPFAWGRAVQSDFESQRANLAARYRIGLTLVAAAIGVATVVSWRIGLFLVFFVLYFGGYPAIQFQTRHYFHLEFITWWAAGFLLQSAIRDVWPLVRERQWDPGLATSVRRAFLLLAACAAGLVVTLWGMRLYQRAAARSLFEGYLAAEKEKIPLNGGSPGPLYPIARASLVTDPETADFLEVEVNGWRCGDDLAVTFRYDKRTRPEFSRRFVAQRHEDLHEPTYIFTPVYEGFQAIELSDTRPGCVDGIYRLRNPRQFPVMLEVILPPRWRRMPMYQQLGEVGSPELDRVP